MCWLGWALLGAVLAFWLVMYVAYRKFIGPAPKVKKRKDK